MSFEYENINDPLEREEGKKVIVVLMFGEALKAVSTNFSKG